MKIKDGYNGKEMEIRIGANPSGSIELWLIQNGLPETSASYRETLSYMTPSELLALKQEIERAAKELFSIQ
jgi:hypothetical protein